MRSLSLPIDSIRWTPDSPSGHVESFFLKANHPERHDRAFWLKFTLLVAPKGGAPRLAEVWAIRFDGTGGTHRAAKGSIEAADATLSRGGLGVVVGDCTLEPGRVRGAVGEGDDRIAWDLTFDYEDQERWLSLPSDWMYSAGFPKSKTYTSCPRTHFVGELSVGGDAWDIQRWPGMLGHNWGLFHNPRYHWAQCCVFDGPGETVFEGFSAKIPLGPFLSPWLTMATVRHDGQEIPFNRFGRVFNRSVSAGLFAWSFRSRQKNWEVEWSVEAPLQDFVALKYVNPDGVLNYCLNSKIADCSVVLKHKEGGKWSEVTRQSGIKSCAYEILTRDPDHNVPVVA